MSDLTATASSAYQQALSVIESVEPRISGAIRSHSSSVKSYLRCAVISITSID